MLVAPWLPRLPMGCYPYYDDAYGYYGPSYGYGPSFGFAFEGGGHHFHGHHRGGGPHWIIPLQSGNL
jgi:hypothetical protein